VATFSPESVATFTEIGTF